MDPWVQEAAAEIGKRAERELEALVGVSSPSGDVHGAEECAAVCAALLPDEAAIERLPCSSPNHAPDVLARLRGTGERRVVLVGHLDTVVAHGDHRPLRAPRGQARRLGRGRHEGRRGARARHHARARRRPEAYAEAALLLVCDEEWRTATVRARRPLRRLGRMPVLRGRRPDAGRRGRRRRAPQGGRDAARRRATAGPRTQARRRTAAATRCSRSPPAAQAVAACHDPAARTGSPPSRPCCTRATRSTSCPAAGELFCDCRADELEAIEARARARSRRTSAASRSTRS